jgi:hypothetical protein
MKTINEPKLNFYGNYKEKSLFRTESGLIPAFSKAGYSPCLLTNNHIR